MLYDQKLVQDSLSWGFNNDLSTSFKIMIDIVTTLSISYLFVFISILTKWKIVLRLVVSTYDHPPPTSDLIKQIKLYESGQKYS